MDTAVPFWECIYLVASLVRSTDLLSLYYLLIYIPLALVFPPCRPYGIILKSRYPSAVSLVPSGALECRRVVFQELASVFSACEEEKHHLFLLNLANVRSPEGRLRADTSPIALYCDTRTGHRHCISFFFFLFFFLFFLYCSVMPLSSCIHTPWPLFFCGALKCSECLSFSLMSSWPGERPTH